MSSKLQIVWALTCLLSVVVGMLIENYRWSKNLRALAKCDHDKMSTANADGWCLICGKFV